jgi:hypothetical protein
MHAQPNGHLVELYRCAAICQTFPAYRLQEIRELPPRELRDLLHATELLHLARQVQS